MERLNNANERAGSDQYTHTHTHTRHGNTLPQVTGKTGKSVRVANNILPGSAAPGCYGPGRAAPGCYGPFLIWTRDPGGK